MLKIDFPDPSFKTREGIHYREIFDPFRKRWIKLTPEEWVRQNFIEFMVQVVGYPASLIAIEREIKLSDCKKRFDIVVFDKSGLPWMLIECKSMESPLTESVISQVLAYRSQVQAPYFFITNGSYTYGWHIANSQVAELWEMPAFPVG